MALTKAWLLISPDVFCAMTLIVIGLAAPILVNSQVSHRATGLITSPIRTTDTAHATGQRIYPLHIARRLWASIAND
jgi:hypothetical protein